MNFPDTLRYTKDHEWIRVEGDVAVGYTLPSTVQIRTIPRHDKFGYTVINERRVIVEPGTRKVIRVIE